ncbi:flagellar biosynthesis anti-sigma factor FlgM [Alkaliphilus oremlandii]|uniref:Negative regulator of flagellin synthesis n=1 Tax=Alkaliphilus oremlandii (strain OhILAs) TaxID=350688 RepID=A8MJS2_ALKOO|nr:flagellar biosynthesis anti-sigma factor FlgM [Alkaliphilus oremlandii]ABW20054.1 anti-sigma-28 factor, FlgM [Alkaliphilus oremlandii OhILAs]
MKIFNHSNVNKAMQIYNNKSTEKLKKSKEVEGPKDEIQLSDKAREYQIAMKAFKSLPETRENLVNELRNQITQGSYSVSGEEIADKIVASVLIDKKI